MAILAIVVAGLITFVGGGKVEGALIAVSIMVAVLLDLVAPLAFGVNLGVVAATVGTTLAIFCHVVVGEMTRLKAARAADGLEAVVNIMVAIVVVETVEGHLGRGRSGTLGAILGRVILSRMLYLGILQFANPLTIHPRYLS